MKNTTNPNTRPWRILFPLLMMAVISTVKAQSVEFAPVGAEWYYGYQEIMETGYIKITAVNDTVIDSQPCVKLEKTRTGYGYYNGWFSRIIGYEYLTVSDDSVGLYRNGAFHKLFDFGAEIGDTWTVPGLIDICEESHGTVTVVDKGSELVNNISLRYLRIVDDINSYWGYSHYMHGEAQDTIKVFERIGPVGSYLLPMQKCEFDSGESGVLRCYSDNETGYFNFHTNYSDINCDYINEQYQSVDEKATENNMAVFPNPCGDKLLVSLKDNNYHKVSIFNCLGNKIYDCSIHGQMAEIDLSFIPSGVYCLTIVNDCSILSKTIVKK